jgi:hypothetical protein
MWDFKKILTRHTRNRRSFRVLRHAPPERGWGVSPRTRAEAGSVPIAPESMGLMMGQRIHLNASH